MEKDGAANDAIRGTSYGLCAGHCIETAETPTTITLQRKEVKLRQVSWEKKKKRKRKIEGAATSQYR